MGNVIAPVGAALAIAGGLVAIMAPLGAIGALAAILIATMVLTELLSNNAAAALMFPIGLATAATLGVDPRPFVIVIMLAASLSFLTPIGYQTNLMVMGPGGYKWLDFLRFGGPLTLLAGVVCVTALALFYGPLTGG